MSKQAISSLIDSFNLTLIERGIEIIVVNNGSTDETALGLLNLQRKYKEQVQIKIVQNDENLGYPVGINCGLEQCNGEIITILNNDLIFPLNWFDGLVKIIEQDPTIGAVAPYLSYASGAQHVGVNFNSIEGMQGFAKTFMENNKEKIVFLDRVIGACMVIKRSVLELIGGNDFWFGVGNYDDDDFSIRLQIAGFKIAIVGSSFVHHIGSVSFKKDVSLFRSAMTTNRQKFIKKWNVDTLDHHGKEKIFLNTSYQKEKHFCPIKIEQYRVPIKKDENNVDKLKVFFVADWLNPQSEWKIRLSELISYDLDNSKLFFWAPSHYYETETIHKEIKEIVSNKKIDLDFLDNNIYQINLLRFLSEFDIFIKVQEDFINKNLQNLAQHSSLNLI